MSRYLIDDGHEWIKNIYITVSRTYIVMVIIVISYHTSRQLIIGTSSEAGINRITGVLGEVINSVASDLAILKRY